MIGKMFCILLALIFSAACAAPQPGPATFTDAESVAQRTGGQTVEAIAVRPTVFSVSPDHGKSGDVITLTGAGLGTDPGAVQVRIGGVPVAIKHLRDTQDGYQELQVELNDDNVSGSVSVYVGELDTTFAGTFCAEPVVRGLTPRQRGSDTIVHIQGSNIDPSALVYVGERLQDPHRLKSARRPHWIDPTALFILVQPSDHGRIRVENRCPDGRSFDTTNTTSFLFLIKV